MYSVAKRRKLIDISSDMSAYAAQILEAPGGKRDLVRRTLAVGFKTEIETYSNLCSEPSWLGALLVMDNVMFLNLIRDL